MSLSSLNVARSSKSNQFPILSDMLLTAYPSSCRSSENILGQYTRSGAGGGSVGSGTALQAGRSRAGFPMLSLEFFIDIILLAALWNWG